MVSINTNVSAMNASRLLDITSTSLAKTTERLSSGRRINRASDDPSGLFSSESMTSQIRGSQAAVLNIQAAQSAVAIADGGLAAITESLQRMKELAVQGSSGVLSTEQRAAINSEYVALRDSVTTMANGASYGGANGFKLLDSTGGTKTLQIGPTTAAVATISFGTSYTGASLVAQATIATQADAVTAQGQIDTAVGTVATGRANLGAQASALDSIKDSLEVQTVALSEARMRVRDADVATEVSNLVQQQIRQQAGASALSAANFSTQFVLSLLQ